MQYLPEYVSSQLIVSTILLSKNLYKLTLITLVTGMETLWEVNVDENSGSKAKGTWHGRKGCHASISRGLVVPSAKRGIETCNVRDRSNADIQSWNGYPANEANLLS